MPVQVNRGEVRAIPAKQTIHVAMHRVSPAELQIPVFALKEFMMGIIGD